MSPEQYRYMKRYRLDRHRGIERSLVDAQPVRDHLRSLMRSGASLRGIATVAGVTSVGLDPILAGRTRRTQRRVARAVLSVTVRDLVAATDPIRVPSIGARRRVQALMAIGWSQAEMTRRAGVDTSSVVHHRGTSVLTTTHDAIARLYAELSMTPGPYRRAQTWAEYHGYPGPAAWDDDTIDDPTAKPSGWVGRAAA